MTNIISEILEIEKTAASIVNKSQKKAEDLVKDAKNEMLRQKNEAAEEIRAAAEEERKKSNEFIKEQNERIDKETEMKIENMNNFYSENKEKILSELFLKALKA